MQLWISDNLQETIDALTRSAESYEKQGMREEAHQLRNEVLSLKLRLMLDQKQSEQKETEWT